MNGRREREAGDVVRQTPGMHRAGQAGLLR